MAVCLVTGGAGFIGSHLVEALLAHGHRVRVLDNFSTGSLKNLEDAAGEVEIVHGDVRSADVVREAAAGADLVFHLAAPTQAPCGLEDPMSTHHCGATGTLQVLLAARAADVRRVVYASSCCVYGDPAGARRSEDEVPHPLSPYAVAKLTGEQHCVGFTGMYGLETVRLRYFNVFGPRQLPSGRYSPKLRQILCEMLAGRRPLIHGGTLELQDLICVQDVVHATLLAATAPRVAGKVYNIASGRPVSTLELVNHLNAILGTCIQPIGVIPALGDETHHLADTERAEVDLGFCPGNDLGQSLRRCVEYYMPRREELAC